MKQKNASSRKKLKRRVKRRRRGKILIVIINERHLLAYDKHTHTHKNIGYWFSNVVKYCYKIFT